MAVWKTTFVSEHLNPDHPQLTKCFALVACFAILAILANSALRANHARSAKRIVD